MDTREIFNKLRRCPQLHRVTTIHGDWLFTWKRVSGFWGHTNSNLGKERKIELIKKHIQIMQLPLTVSDDPTHLTRIKITINGDNASIATKK